MSAILSLVSNFLSLFGKVADLINRRNDRAAGANEVTAQNLKAENEAQKKMLDTAVTDTDDDVVARLRNGGF